ncbi:MAG TPA: hypothetical protein VL752_20890 [Acidisoma sp.]|uniref:hypothetical protein n=1 Tax=Acidisoma sp. TaxID=1872115 RepID=UPI002BBFA040|nr:hypothetical protein [Acidisoma sp.]HTI03410.1 hypothetical protein [Acidisoma sp.]
MRRFHSFLLATATLALPLPAAAPAMAQVSVDPNALNALGSPVLPAPPRGARPGPAHHARPAHKATHHKTGQGRTHQETGTASAPKSPESAAPSPPAAATGPTEQQKGLGPSFTTLPTLPGAAPPIPAKPKPVAPPAAPPPKAAQPKAAQPAAVPANPAGASVALPRGAPPAPPVVPQAVAPQPPAKSANPPGAPLALPGAPPPAPAATQPKAAAAPPAAPTQGQTKGNALPNALPSGADRMTLPYSGQDTDLPAAESAMLTAFVHRYGPEAQYSVQAFASVPAGDDDPSTPRRIALERARTVQSVLLAAGAKPNQVRLLARGNAGGTPPDRVEVVAIPPAPGHTPPSSAP